MSMTLISRLMNIDVDPVVVFDYRGGGCVQDLIRFLYAHDLHQFDKNDYDQLLNDYDPACPDELRSIYDLIRQQLF